MDSRHVQFVCFGIHDLKVCVSGVDKMNTAWTFGITHLNPSSPDTTFNEYRSWNRTESGTTIEDEKELNVSYRQRNQRPLTFSQVDAISNSYFAILLLHRYLKQRLRPRLQTSNIYNRGVWMLIMCGYTNLENMHVEENNKLKTKFTKTAELWSSLDFRWISSSKKISS